MVCDALRLSFLGGKPLWVDLCVHRSPPIAEQKRIAAILDKAEEIRSQRRQALEQLDALTQSIFLEMFGDPEKHNEKWTNSCLGDIAIFVGGGTPKRERPEYFEGLICWATSKDMKSEFLNDTQEHITPQAIEESATNLVPTGTILMVVKSKILAHSLPISITKVPTCFGQDIKGIRISDGHEVTFVVNALRQGKQWLLDRARGINTEGLTLEHLKAFPLLIPPIALQQEFARRVEAIAQLKTTHRESLAQLDDLFASLQHRAFRGEL
jgi:type I restriction enzyme, S subunit